MSLSDAPRKSNVTHIGRARKPLSALAAGVVADRLGYSAAFLFLGLAAGVAWVVFLVAMPETKGGEAAADSPAAAAVGAPGE